MEAQITPLRVKGLIAPVMRTLPTIFTYARITAQTRGHTSQALDDEFNASMTALANILEEAGRQADLPWEARRPLQDQVVELANLAGEDLARGLDRFCADLTAWHQEHGKTLKKAAVAAGERFRDLYRQSALTKRLLICYCEGLDTQSESLERKLTERCYYDCEPVGEDWGQAQTGSADLVLFAPTERPIPGNLTARAEAYGMPFLILMGGDRAQDMQNMALMKSEFLYRRSGCNVLRSPFNPPRLYSAIDSICLRHLAGSVLALPEVRRAAAADAVTAAAGEG